MAEDGEGGERSEGDPRMKMLEIYGLKTLKQVYMYMYCLLIGIINVMCSCICRKETSGLR